MPIFTYIAVDAACREVRGHIAADTPRQARDRLRGQGLTIQRIATRESRLALGAIRCWVQRRHRGEVTELLGELATLLSVGMPIVEALDTVTARFRGGMRAALLDLRERLVSGGSLAGAMSQHPGLFDPVCLSIVEVGERAGTLDASLAQLAEFRSRAEQTRGRLVAALIYPVIVLLTGVGVGIFLMTYVVPSLLTVLEDAGKPLPTATRIVKTASDGLLGGWWLMLTGILGVAGLYGFWVRTDRGRLIRDRTVLRVPVFGRLLMLVELSRITNVLETLLRNGVELATGFDIAARGTRNVILAGALRETIVSIERGAGAAEALQSTSVFDPSVTAVFRVGVESGRLEEVLAKLTADCERRVSIATRRLAAILEPMLILLLAVLIGFVAFATILPILEAGDVLG